MASKLTPKASFYLGFLLILNVFNFAHRQMPISLGYQIENGLGISHAQLGLLIGFAFVALYSVAGMLFGTVADRWNRPRLIALGLSLWAAATVVSGLSQSFVQIALLRLLVGTGAAVLTPAALGMLADVYRPEKRAFAAGVYYGGIPLGAGLSLIVVALLEPVLGWRACFYVAGAAGLLLVPFMLLLKDPPRGGVEAAATSPTSHPPVAHRSTAEVLGEIVGVARRSPALVASVIGSVIVLWPISALTLGVTWLQLERGFTMRQAGLYSGVIFLVAGFLGNTVGGWLSDLCHRRWRGGRLWFLALVQLVIGPPALAWYVLPKDSVWFYVVWFVGSFAATGYFGPIFATVQDLVPARVRSTMVGVLLLLVNLFATGLAPWVAGAIGDATTLTRGLVICTLVGFLSVPFFVFAARRYATDIGRLGR
ncbi:MAG TPA: MFS transporter [Thermoanaerobaculales bacterium]|nr:MFS transporter [Thermoanaerobaculales bacterium]HPA82240.1 MFS transporter [Thermoanaerobaculales bacterium]HQN96542.1 MFS transporter [Thermoanaerobaculales bacterium]HQP43892.1 MFS transporter [Thermoanaerobaculales bacterium]